MHFKNEQVFQQAKFKELKEAIVNRNFPIIVYGPSGSGKSFTILKVLESLDIKHKYVELEGKPINKPIQSNLVTLVYLYKQSDIEKIKFRNNLIIETSISWANKITGFKAIKFNRITLLQASKYKIKNYQGNLFTCHHNGQSNEEIDFFKFLGRIFYKKISVSEISIENNLILYSQPIKKQIETHCQSFIEEDSTSSELQQGRRFILDDSESEILTLKQIDHDNCSISFDEDLIFESSDILEIQKPNDFLINLAISNLKNLITSDDFNFKTPNVSFNLNTFESFIYNSFVHFVSLKDLPETYDCLSLTDFDKKSFLCFIQRVLESKEQDKRKFFSFLPSQINPRQTRNMKNRMWRYQQNLPK